MDVTLITVNFNTRNCLELLLKSYVRHHYKGFPLKLLLWDNNSTDGSKDFLCENNIPFFESPTNIGHENSLNVLFNAITTQYCIISDTDVIYYDEVFSYFDHLIDGVVAAGDLVRGDQLGESQIKPRLGAWQIFFDVPAIKAAGIKTFRTKEDASYDVMSEFYEMIWKRNLGVHIIPRLPGHIDHENEGMRFGKFSHFGKMSWDLTKHPDREGEVIMRRKYVEARLNEFRDVDLKEKFI